MNVKRSGDPEIDEKRRKRRDYIYQARKTERERLRELENWKPPFCTPADIREIFIEAGTKFSRHMHADAA